MILNSAKSANRRRSNNDGAWRGHKGVILCTKIYLNTLYTGSQDKTVREWDLKTGTCVRVYEGHTGSVQCIDVVDVLSFYTASGNDIHKWDSRSGNVIKSYKGHEGIVRSIIVSEDNEIIVGTSAPTIYAFDSVTGNITGRFIGHSSSISCLFLDKQTKTLFSASDDNTIRQWNLKTAETIKIFTSDEDYTWTCLYAVGDLLFSGSRSNNNYVICWNIKTGNKIMKYGPYSEGIMSIIVEEGTLIIAAGENIHLWDITKNNCIKTIQNKSWIHSMQILENKLYISYEDGSVRSKYISTKMMTSIKESAMKKSENLNLSMNQISVFPSVLTKCNWIKHLNLSNNYLRLIPSQMAKGLALLQHLDLSHNILNSLPEEFSDLKYLEYLDISHNKFRSLSPCISSMRSLSHLNISNNQIKFLMPFLTKIPIKHLNVSNNPIEDPPNDICLKGLDAIMEYLKGTQNEKEVPVGRIKLMFVGNENVGKTSLVLNLRHKSKMFNAKPNIKTISTDGISINNITLKDSNKKLKSKQKEKKGIKFTTWDFGGQEVYYTTHQFFITRNSIYILVWDMSKSIDDQKLEYWLRSIESQTVDIGMSHTDVPIVIVGTHLDTFKGDQKDIDNINNSILEKFSARYPSIFYICNVSCKTGKGIAELKKALQEICLKSESVKRHIEKKVPEKIFQLEQALLRLKSVKVPPILSWREYSQIARGYNISNEKLEEYTILLHKLGSLVYFKDSKQSSQSVMMGDFIILDPQWLVDLFSTVITTSPNFVRNGIIKPLDLPLIWRDHEKFPPSVHKQMISILEKYDIALPLRFKRKFNKTTVYKDQNMKNITSVHLIPSLLPVIHPRLDIIWPEKEDTFQIERHNYFGEFLPPGIFSRLIVRLLNTNIVYYYWRHGVVISDQRRYAFSLVKEDPEKKMISISIRGRQSYITKFMVEIMDSFNRLIIDSCRIAVSSYAICSHCLTNGLPEPSVFSQDDCEKLIFKQKRFIRCEVGNCLVRIDHNFPDLCLYHLNKIEIDPQTLRFPEGKSPEQCILGEGGYGLVYKMKWNDTDVAVKKLKHLNESELTRNEIKKIYSSFRNEVWLMSGIKHKNIVNLLGFSLTGETLMVMEYISGGDLFHSILNKKLKISWLMIMRILLDIAKGMLFLHSMNPPLIHGDLKCPNVMICSWDEKAEVVAKVADFGLSSKLYEEKLDKPPQLNPFWTAPEILLRRPFDEKADCYSFGVIMWNLLTRKAIFEEKLPWTSEITNLICSGERPPIPERKDIPKDYIALLKACWAQKPDMRPSYEEIIVKLHKIIEENFPELIPYTNQNNYDERIYFSDFNNEEMNFITTFQSNANQIKPLNRLKLIKQIQTGVPIKILITVGMTTVWAYSEQNVIYVIDSISGQILKLFNVQYNINTMIHVYCDGEINDVWASSDEGLLIWDADMHILKRHLLLNKNVTALEWKSFNNKNFVWSGRNSIIEIWNPLTYECVKEINLKNSAAPPPDGAFITKLHFGLKELWAAVSNVVYKININGDVDETTFLFHESVVKQIQFSKLNQIWVLTYGNTISIWSNPGDEFLSSIENVKISNFLIDGSKVYVFSEDGSTIEVWNASTHEIIYSIESKHSNPLNCVLNAFSRTIWTASDDDFINVFIK